MKELHFPFIEISILIPFLGAIAVARLRNAHQARSWSAWITGAALICAVAA